MATTWVRWPGTREGARFERAIPRLTPRLVTHGQALEPELERVVTGLAMIEKLAGIMYGDGQ